ncbi:MAG: pitrilysin family protein [Verrucomicrobiota bacterium]
MHQPEYRWTRISGGPRLAVATLPQSECAALSIHIPAGSRDEDGLPAGLAHFVEHMVFKGTKRRGAKEISFDIENCGGQINACTSEDQTVYDARAEAGNLEILADVLCDMVWNPVFPEPEIDLERDVIAEEITMYRESPSDHIGDMISAALWGSHPLGNAISGNHRSIARIRRPHLTDFVSRHHFRDDLVIAAAGNFTLEEVLETIRPHVPEGFHAGFPALPFDPASITPGNLREERGSDQLQLALAWHAPGRHSEMRHALRVLSILLGESSSSRLFLELREERGLCYQISTDVTFLHETGAFEISAGLAHDAREESLDCIFRHIRHLCMHEPSEEETERAKRIAISQSKIAFESTAAHASWAGESMLDLDRVPHPAEWREKILGVSRAGILEAARLVFDGKTHAVAEIS